MLERTAQYLHTVVLQMLWSYRLNGSLAYLLELATSPNQRRGTPGLDNVTAADAGNCGLRWHGA